MGVCHVFLNCTNGTKLGNTPHNTLSQLWGKENCSIIKMSQNIMNMMVVFFTTIKFPQRILEKTTMQYIGITEHTSKAA